MVAVGGGGASLGWGSGTVGRYGDAPRHGMHCVWLVGEEFSHILSDLECACEQEDPWCTLMSAILRYSHRSLLSTVGNQLREEEANRINVP